MIDNFAKYAMSSYDNPNATIEEFKRDCDRFGHLNKLFHRYYSVKTLRARLILNHIITLYNVFKPEGCTAMLFHKIKPEYWPGLKTCLIFLSFMPDTVEGINSSDIAIDFNIADELRGL